MASLLLGMGLSHGSRAWCGLQPCLRGIPGGTCDLTLAFTSGLLFSDMCFLFCSMGGNLSSSLYFHQNWKRNKSKKPLAKNIWVWSIYWKWGATLPLMAYTVELVHWYSHPLKSHWLHCFRISFWCFTPKMKGHFSESFTALLLTVWTSPSTLCVSSPFGTFLEKSSLT